MKTATIMKFIRYIIIASVLGGSFTGYGQQDPMFTQYMFNTLSVNPAYAGIAEVLSANAIYRNQWVNFDGAPVTQTVAVHSPLRQESISLGGTIINDSHGPVKQTGFYVDISYRIFLEKSKLAFGLKGGVNMYQANLTALNPVIDDDPVFGADISNKFLPNFGSGVMWYSDRAYLGLSVPKLLTNKLIDGSLPDFENNTERQHFFLIGGMVFDINNYVQFKPSFLVKAVNGAPPSFDLTANFLINEQVWIGGMYRWQESIGILGQYVFNHKFRVGYAYDLLLSDIGNYSPGSHEIMLGFDLFRGVHGDVSPRYF